ncbi:MAG: hypothetical protein HGB21_02830 [Nitrospirae bacterium]|nr:hypothetical protein [Nitrospirota bacterium]
MKWFITIMTIIVLSFAVTAFADDPAEMNTRDTGTMLYQESLLLPTPIQATIIPEEKLVDVGVAMYEEYLAHEKEVAAFGVAAGGKGAVKVVDQNTRIWESYFGLGSDLP